MHVFKSLGITFSYMNLLRNIFQKVKWVFFLKTFSYIKIQKWK